jgi:hypothetical protein
MRWLAVVVFAVAGCSADSALKPGDFAGRWPMQQIDGHALGWYHWTNVDCQAAPTGGELVIDANRSWSFEMPYDYRCVGAAPVDGSAVLTVSGTDARATGTIFLLLGRGPDLVADVPDTVPWTLEVTPDGEMIRVRFTGDARYVWADPILTMGPRTAQ